ncbi:MAG: glycosyltransferase, partial [Eubacterium sp.]
SQLIKRKRIDGIINNFNAYLKAYDNNCRLYILGDGDERDNLQDLVKNLGLDNSVIFKGRLAHEELKDYLASAKAMLVNTEKDNNMVSIVEAIACGTPVITTTVPYNASYIKAHKLGIAKDCWNADDMYAVANDISYIDNCIEYRKTLSCQSKADTFIDIAKKRRLI